MRNTHIRPVSSCEIPASGKIAGKGGKRGARVQHPLQFHEPPDRLSLLKMIPAHQFHRGGLSKFGEIWGDISPNLPISPHLNHNPMTVGQINTDLDDILPNECFSTWRSMLNFVSPFIFPCPSNGKFHVDYGVVEVYYLVDYLFKGLVAPHAHGNETRVGFDAS